MDIGDIEETILAELYAQPLPTHAALHAFLRSCYKHDRFEGRDGNWGDYSATVTRSAMESLEDYGWALISHHEAASGRMIVYDRSLTIRERTPFSEARERLLGEPEEPDQCEACGVYLDADDAVLVRCLTPDLEGNIVWLNVCHACAPHYDRGAA